MADMFLSINCEALVINVKAKLKDYKLVHIIIRPAPHRVQRSQKQGNIL